ncbi:uncharacterized protein C8Q71DRAFT_409209 [Rhodofomes roseus]|uniref:Uncharacterized protein n=1 Tax=Rhodofomes roseus TaxID=34475 RepID=A0ABQ8JYN2_9APHY|nr:uncharacterized protein C8Q71DRAFT_409209 [Rhodofomes roseus]KAH9829379.1 hypothetical protein C8Q71DRAFT_409209 [Rhodofomes roseus]
MAIMQLARRSRAHIATSASNFNSHPPWVTRISYMWPVRPRQLTIKDQQFASLMHPSIYLCILIAVHVGCVGFEYTVTSCGTMKPGASNSRRACRAGHSVSTSPRFCVLSFPSLTKLLEADRSVGDALVSLKRLGSVELDGESLRSLDGESSFACGASVLAAASFLNTSLHPVVSRPCSLLIDVYTADLALGLLPVRASP